MNIIEKKVNVTLCEDPIPYTYEEVPQLDAEDFNRRIESAWNMPQTEGLDFLVIYGDREHFSNIHYFCGYDIRWEESLMIIGRNQKPILFVGNEGLGYSKALRSDVDIKMYQTFSLVGQPNDERSLPLKELLQSCGIVSGCKIGLIGWKMFRKDLFSLNHLITDVPHYIVQTLANITGIENIQNATDILIDCEYGLKHHVTAKEIVQFDAAGTKVSRGVYHFLKNMHPGITKPEAAELIGFDGEPLTMHPSISFGDKNVSKGPEDTQYTRKLEYGMAISAGYGLRGCLVHRSGMYIRSKEDLPEDKKHFVDELVKPYFACVVKWYEMMKIGTCCGDIYQMVEDTLGMEKFHIGLNPGHLSHTDEWTNSPIAKDSKVKLRSGMALQCDFTVGFQSPSMTTHIEDGLVIADEALRLEIQRIAPTCYQRIIKRQQFIREVLGVDLPEEALPLSDLSCVCFPYMADVNTVFAKC